MKMQLRDYQERMVSDLAEKLSYNRKVVAQLPTGSGKSLTFAGICDRYIKRSNKAVLILVHRKELLQQTRRTLHNAFGIQCQPIIAGMKHIPMAAVYVGMIESVSKRIRMLNNIGMVIIDECHIASFNKIHIHFPDQLIIGFTATPLSASKKHPLKSNYDDIVCGPEIAELIELKSLCQNITFAPKDTVDRMEMASKKGGIIGNDFNEGIMAVSFSKPRYVINTVKAYEDHCKGTKTIVFNVNINHSNIVNNAFIAAGYPSDHLDGEMNAMDRDRILKWFKTTPGAILNNVGVLSVGYDEPSIESVIVNKSTCSMPLWLQLTGRASRPYNDKELFTIVDMGGNAMAHGDWCDVRDWSNIFFNPPKYIENKDSIAPVKNCPACDAIIPAPCRTCKHCGFIFPSKEQAKEEELSDFVVVTKNINVKSLIEKNNRRKEYYTFYEIGRTLAIQAKQTIPIMTDDNANFILSNYYDLVKDWCLSVNKKFSKWHESEAKAHLFSELQVNFKKWEPLEPVPIRTPNVARETKIITAPGQNKLVVNVSDFNSFNNYFQLP